MQRLGWVIRLAPDAEAEYRRLHAEVWPAVVSRLAEAHITNYSIFLHGDLLFGYMEYLGDDLERDLAWVDDDPETKRWHELTEPLQRPLDTAPQGEWWAKMEEVWHMDGGAADISAGAHDQAAPA